MSVLCVLQNQFSNVWSVAKAQSSSDSDKYIVNIKLHPASN